MLALLFYFNFCLRMLFLFIAAGTQSSDKAWYQTVWFLALCAFAFVLIMFIFIVCCCRGYRKNQSVYVRERQPLPSKLKHKSRASSLNEFLSPKSTPHRRLGSVSKKISWFHTFKRKSVAQIFSGFF